LRPSKPKPPDLGKYTAEEQAIIRELEEKAKGYRPKAEWTPFQVDLLKRFHGKVPAATLASKVQHGQQSVAEKAHQLGITRGIELREVTSKKGNVHK